MTHTHKNKMITFYHNPRCSKSRETLALIQAISTERSLPIAVVDYQKNPPSLAQLQELQQQLGLPAQAMLRNNEDEYSVLNLASADETALLAAVASHPKLLQRPIVSFAGKAAIGRPPEQVLALFEEENKVST
jgi:arsenate reductase